MSDEKDTPKPARPEYSEKSYNPRTGVNNTAQPKAPKETAQTTPPPAKDD